jgi:hypothetical protein
MVGKLAMVVGGFLSSFNEKDMAISLMGSVTTLGGGHVLCVN